MPIIFEDESRTPSTFCYESFESQANFHQTIHGENLATEICSLYGIPPGGQEYNEGALQLNKNGHPPSDDIGSVDITGFSHEDGKWVWNLGPSTNQDCIDRTNVSVLCIECDAGWNADQSEFCLGSGTECAMDLDCCQSPGAPMFCHPVWGTCYHTGNVTGCTSDVCFESLMSYVLYTKLALLRYETIRMNVPRDIASHHPEPDPRFAMNHRIIPMRSSHRMIPIPSCSTNNRFTDPSDSL